METLPPLSINAAASIRRATLGGREYLVAPLTTIVPGVLAGSKGALYYSPEEIQRNIGDWNNMPLVVYHPTTEDGQHVSARHPGIIEKSGIGFARNSQYKGKLVHEGWFDAERTRQVDPRVYDALVKGQRIELSTGLFTDNEEAPEGSNHKGKAYRYVAKNYRPDHIAILPDQVGACILPGQEIQGRIVKASKARYTGEAVRIRTASGKSLAVTANHPVLTNRGFVSAGQLTKGQHLLHYVGKDEPLAADGDKKNAPAVSEDVFETLESFSGTKKCVRSSPLDFHGDATFFQGNVEVVSAESTLGSNCVSQSSESFSQGSFRRGCNSQSSLPSGSHLEQLLDRVNSPDAGKISCGSESLTFIRGESVVHQPGCIRTIARDTPTLQPLVDNSVVDTGFFADVESTIATDISSDDGLDEFYGESLVEDSILAKFCVFGSGAELNACLPKTVSNRRVMEAKLFRQLLHAFPSKVTVDKIVSIDRFCHDGPVYDFETTTGYIIAEGLIVSNCSINDGCGVLVNANPKGINQYTSGDKSSLLHKSNLKKLPRNPEGDSPLAVSSQEAITSGKFTHLDHSKLTPSATSSVHDLVADLTSSISNGKAIHERLPDSVKSKGNFAFHPLLQQPEKKALLEMPRHQLLTKLVEVHQAMNAAASGVVHYGAVKAALKEGVKIHPSALEDYPHLQATNAHKPTPPPKPSKPVCPPGGT